MQMRKKIKEIAAERIYCEIVVVPEWVNEKKFQASPTVFKSSTTIHFVDAVKNIHSSLIMI